MGRSEPPWAKRPWVTIIGGAHAFSKVDAERCNGTAFIEEVAPQVVKIFKRFPKVRRFIFHLECACLQDTYKGDKLQALLGEFDSLLIGELCKSRFPQLLFRYQKLTYRRRFQKFVEARLEKDFAEIQFEDFCHLRAVVNDANERGHELSPVDFLSWNSFLVTEENIGGVELLRFPKSEELSGITPLTLRSYSPDEWGMTLISTIKAIFSGSAIDSRVVIEETNYSSSYRTAKGLKYRRNYKALIAGKRYLAATISYLRYRLLCGLCTRDLKLARRICKIARTSDEQTVQIVIRGQAHSRKLALALLLHGIRSRIVDTCAKLQ